MLFHCCHRRRGELLTDANADADADTDADANTGADA